MKFDLNPLKQIPEHLRDEYKSVVARCIQSRLRTFTVTGYIIFVFAMIYHSFTSYAGTISQTLRAFLILTAGAGLVFYFSRCIKCIVSAKLTAFLFTLLMLFLLNYGPMHRPTAFAYSPHMLSLIFSTLMFPWFMRDAAVITLFHFTAWFLYCLSRDMAHIQIPPTAFGDDPVVVGTIFLTITAVLVLIIRHKDNQRDIQNFVLLKEIESRKQQMERELQFASKIQSSLVPRPLKSANADVFITYKPIELIGGDYANFQLLNQNKLIFFIGDITGHGVPAALMVNRLHTEFGRLAALSLQPGAILRDLNRFILRAFEGTSMYLTAFCGMIDFQEKKIYYSNYGHPPQYIFRLKDAAVTALEPMTSLLGVGFDDEDATFENHIDYHEGDLILMFTDGILEHKNSTDEQYGAGKLQRFIQTRSDKSPETIHAELIQDLQRFGTSDFKDDVFVVSIKCKTTEKAERFRTQKEQVGS